MAIHFVTGRPGAGKGLYSMKLLIEEIMGTDRAIVSNLAVHPDLLAEYMHNEYGQSFDLLTRWFFLEDEHLNEFYCYRGPDTKKLKVDYDDKGKAIAYEIDEAMKTDGVFYILDEVHLAFGARDWMNTGRACMHYASQHRKLGDDVILVTQAPKNVDNQFRSLAQDYTVIRNHGMEKFFFFKQPDVFSRQTFLNLPTGSVMDKPQEKGMFRMNLDVANCYDTSAGVGIHERGGADKGKDKRKGMSMGWIIAIAIVGLFILFQLPDACKSAARSFTDRDVNRTDFNATTPPKKEEPRTPPPKKEPPKVVQDINRTVEPPPLLTIEPEQVSENVDNDVDKVFIIGYVKRRLGEVGLPTMILSDGRTVYHGTGYETATSKGITMRDGSFIPFDPVVDVSKVFAGGQ